LSTKTIQLLISWDCLNPRSFVVECSKHVIYGNWINLAW